MARFVYIDESGTGRSQPYLYVVAAVVDEEQVQPLASDMRRVAQHYLGFPLPKDFEFHGSQLWNGTHHWAGKAPPELIAYQDAIGILNTCDIGIAHACIDKAAAPRSVQGRIRCQRLPACLAVPKSGGERQAQV